MWGSFFHLDMHINYNRKSIKNSENQLGLLCIQFFLKIKQLTIERHKFTRDANTFCRIIACSPALPLLVLKIVCHLLFKTQRKTPTQKFVMISGKFIDVET